MDIGLRFVIDHKNPFKKMTFILMANSDILSAPYPLGNGDICVSPYAKEFLKSFVLEGAKL